MLSFKNNLPNRAKTLNASSNLLTINGVPFCPVSLTFYIFIAQHFYIHCTVALVIKRCSAALSISPSRFRHVTCGMRSARYKYQFAKDSCSPYTNVLPLCLYHIIMEIHRPSLRKERAVRLSILISLPVF